MTNFNHYTESFSGTHKQVTIDEVLAHKDNLEQLKKNISIYRDAVQMYINLMLHDNDIGLMCNKVDEIRSNSNDKQIALTVKEYFGVYGLEYQIGIVHKLHKPNWRSARMYVSAIDSNRFGLKLTNDDGKYNNYSRQEIFLGFYSMSQWNHIKDGLYKWVLDRIAPEPFEWKSLT